MTDLTGILEDAVERVRTIKANRAKRYDDHNIPSTVLAFRGDDLIAQIWPERAVDRDALLGCVLAAAVGFAADVLVTVHETWYATVLENPVTGKAWRAREMQDVAERHDGVARGWVTDAVMVVAYNRAGDLRGRSLPYRVAGRRLQWLEHPDWDELVTEANFSGYLFEQIQRALARPTIWQALYRAAVDPAEFGLDVEEAQARVDVAVVKLLTGRSGPPRPDWLPPATVALAGEPKSKRFRLLRRQLPSGKVIRL